MNCDLLTARLFACLPDGGFVCLSFGGLYAAHSGVGKRESYAQHVEEAQL